MNRFMPEKWSWIEGSHAMRSEKRGLVGFRWPIEAAHLPHEL